MKMKIKYKKSKARKFPRTEGCKSAESKDLLSAPHNKGRDPYQETVPKNVITPGLNGT